MPSIVGKKYPTPILKPVLPFFLAGGIVYYGIWKAQTAMMAADAGSKDKKSNGH